MKNGEINHKYEGQTEGELIGEPERGTSEEKISYSELRMGELETIKTEPPTQVMVRVRDSWEQSVRDR